uniref:Uncharacterized protein n=1 Tax=Magallana gigas TaxID=29159 RepID=K1PU05_MAGGI
MLLAIADLNKRRSLLATEKGVENVTTDRGFTDNGTTTNLRMDSQSSTGSHMLEHLSSSLGNGPFSHPRSLMSSYTSPLNHGGRYPLKGQFLSHSARLMEVTHGRRFLQFNGLMVKFVPRTSTFCGNMKIFQKV